MIKEGWRGAEKYNYYLLKIFTQKLRWKIVEKNDNNFSIYNVFEFAVCSYVYYNKIIESPKTRHSYETVKRENENLGIFSKTI